MQPPKTMICPNEDINQKRRNALPPVKLANNILDVGFHTNVLWPVPRKI